MLKSQILPLTRSLNLEHHITSFEKPADEVTKKTKNADRSEQWVMNDGLLLTPWLLINNKEEVLSMIYGGDTTYLIWKIIHDQLFPNTENSEAHLKNNL